MTAISYAVGYIEGGSGGGGGGGGGGGDIARTGIVKSLQTP